MMINKTEVKNKFNIGQHVFFLHNDKPEDGIISGYISDIYTNSTEIEYTVVNECAGFGVPESRLKKTEDGVIKCMSKFIDELEAKEVNAINDKYKEIRAKLESSK